MGGGAWPFLVGGRIYLVNSVDDRDIRKRNSVRNCFFIDYFLEELCVSNTRMFEAVTGPRYP